MCVWVLELTSGRRLSVITLGDVKVEVYRPNGHVGVHNLWRSTPIPNRDVPPQACLYRKRDMSTTLVQQTFQQAEVKVIDVQRNDTVLVYSDGVMDNVGQGELLNVVNDAYAQGPRGASAGHRDLGSYRFLLAWRKT